MNTKLGLAPTTEDPRTLNDADPTKGTAAATARLQAEGLPVTDENIFITASLLDKGIAFLKGQAEVGVRKISADDAPASASGSNNRYAVTVNGAVYKVVLDGSTASVNGQDFSFDVAEDSTPTDDSSPPVAASASTDVCAELPGKVLRLVVQEGAGDTLLVLEALKMEIEVNSPVDGTVAKLSVEAGATVVAGDFLAAVV